MKPTAPRGEAAARIRAYFEAHPHAAPSLRQLQDACGISSTSVVSYNLRALAETGFLTATDDTHTARRFRLAHAPDVQAVALRLVQSAVPLKNNLAVVDSRALAALRKAVQG